VTTIKTYVAGIRSVVRNVSRYLGEDTALESQSDRVAGMSILAALCVLIKLLVDKGVITDADVQTAYAALNADTASYPDAPPTPIGGPPPP
jgi:hypothetical protein